MKAISQYLDNYAEKECEAVRYLFDTKETPFESVVVVPALDEKIDFVERLAKKQRNILLILVLNQQQHSECSRQNSDLFNTLITADPHHKQQDNVYHLRYHNLDIILVDRFTKKYQIPKKKGVGMARKIGADIACTCIVSGVVLSPWIYSTDADAHLPNNYFDGASTTTTEVSVKVFEFFHTDDGTDVAAATLQYEKGLKYYLAGLRWANSPYAFYTLGSTLAIKMLSYCQVRGFPKRAAGEDFYLLNKLAKVGNVIFDQSIIVGLEPRVSNRVPFGTGPAVNKILQDNASGQKFHYYNPEIFQQLRLWLNWVDKDLYTQLSKVISTKELQTQLEHELSKELFSAVTALNFSKFVDHATEQCRTKEALLRHFHSWFDAFRTLKFIHFLQDQYFSPVPIETCLVSSKQWKTEIVTV